MNNHYHILIETPEAKLVECVSYLLELARYVVLNGAPAPSFLVKEV